ncbi:MAG TPA: dihydroorotate dehydrogenase (quinone), partial [Rhodobacteraceae bacterium]|nr:dihydroorotate dehydrogenase (quinone) [Paracoccaceae bacterium]
QLAGLALPNPIGLAAGFDKNAQALNSLAACGFGFLEVGAATPVAQPGNPKPRLFRLPSDCAVINRFGFNNDGMAQIALRLQKRPKHPAIGLNLGANKDSHDRAADFGRVLRHCAAHLDFATINVSSPNTEKLRDLQGKAALSALIAGVMQIRDDLKKPIPIFLKIAPDLDPASLEDIAEVVLLHEIDAVIATNTTLDRNGLNDPHKNQKGGLSGAPLFEKSTRILAQLSNLLGEKIPLIGVGGVSDAQHAYEKILAGASAVQLYTALAYQGLSLVPTLNEGLDALLKKNGFASIDQAVGTGRGRWL